ncbi:MAG: hypothetical protein JWN86_2715 [Planctomycetota bacterium]|nr:hypothetical protein [Planctomycetota bacterium]
MSENENAISFKAFLPGLRPEDAQTIAHGDTLTLRGEFKSENEQVDVRYHLRERRHSQLQREATPSTQISIDKAQTHVENGVRPLPKAEEAMRKQSNVAKPASANQEAGPRSTLAPIVTRTGRI